MNFPSSVSFSIPKCSVFKVKADNFKCLALMLSYIVYIAISLKYISMSSMISYLCFKSDIVVDEPID